MIPVYDTIEGIQTYLTDLGRLNQLVVDRHRAGYERHEKLNEFVILGSWATDTCGNFGVVKFEDVNYNALDIRSSLPPVLTLKDVYKYGVDTISTSSRLGMPKIGQICFECQEHWTIQNAYDFDHHSKDDHPMHKKCRTIHNSRKWREYYVAIFQEAGFNPVLRETPNERCSKSCCGPWSIGSTPRGDIKIGWRSSVINIDWSKLIGSPNYLHLFTEENVTKDKTFIHAHSRKDAIIYLRRIKNAIDESRIEFK